VTQLNDHPEDPAGFRIEPDGKAWRWVRIADETTQGGFKSREAACEDAAGQDREV
jgi:hypothetical protein